MKKYQLKNCSDARIFIDFKDKKHPVRFKYPSKESLFNLILWTMIQIFLTLVFIFIVPNFIIFITWSFLQPVEQSLETHSNSLHLLPSAIFWFTEIIYVLIIIPILSTLVFMSNEKWVRQMPRIQVKLGRIFGSSYSNTCIRKLNSKIYELPIFDNVSLEYKTTKDFAKYLEKIEITEHDFWYTQEPSFWKSFFKKKKKKRKQTDYWKAKFYFEEIPQKGQMELKWI